MTFDVISVDSIPRSRLQLQLLQLPAAVVADVFCCRSSHTKARTDVLLQKASNDFHSLLIKFYDKCNCTEHRELPPAFSKLKSTWLGVRPAAVSDEWIINIDPLLLNSNDYNDCMNTICINLDTYKQLLNLLVPAV